MVLDNRGYQYRSIPPIQYIYFARATPGGDEYPSANNQTTDTPCSNKPCQNGGLCVITSNTYNCLCTAGWSG